MSSEILDPNAGGGELARQIAADYGFQPMAASLFDLNTFYFYLTLSDGETMVQMPLPENLDGEGLRRGLEEGLKRFATGLLKTVALSAPEGVPPYMRQQMQMQQPPGNEFQTLREFLSADFDIETATLDDGEAPANTDVLMVVDPADLDSKAVFAIDQFLMRGGTVVVAAGGYRATLAASSLYASPVQTGLEAWLKHHGITLDQTFVMDYQNTAFPVPVVRQVGAFRFQDLQLRDYPYFIDVRDDGLNQDLAFTAELPQLTVAWASPLDVDEEANAERGVTTLFHSSDASWRSSSTEIMPNLGAEGDVVYTPEGDVGQNPLAVMVEGRFDSFFDESPLLDETEAVDDESDPGDDGAEEDESEEDTLGTVATLIDKSPESARLIVIGSASFLADQTVRMIGSADGTIYTASLELMANIVDWAVEDQSLLGIRSRGHFNRTLDPTPQDEQRVWEYVNYALALAGLLLVFGISRQRRRAKEQAYRAQLDTSAEQAGGAA